MTFWDAVTLGAGATLGHIMIPIAVALVILVVALVVGMGHYWATEWWLIGDGRRARREVTSRLSNEWRFRHSVVYEGGTRWERLRVSYLKHLLAQGRVEEQGSIGTSKVRWAQP